MSKYQFHLLGFLLIFVFWNILFWCDNKQPLLFSFHVFYKKTSVPPLSRGIESVNFTPLRYDNLGKFRIAYHSNGRSRNSCSRVQSQNSIKHGTLLNPDFMNINGNLWIFMNFERALRVCLFLNTFLERSFEFVKCLVCQLCFCTLDFVWIPFSVQVLNSKFFQYFKASDTYKRRQKPHTNHFKKVYFPSFWSKSVWFLDQNSWQNFLSFHWIGTYITIFMK